MWQVFARFVLVLFLSIITARADDRSKGDFEINLWASPYHLGKAPEGETFVQTKQGLGLRYYYFVVPTEVELFVDVNRFKSNTFGPTTTLRLGEQAEVGSVGRFGVVFGVAFEVLRYRNQQTGKTHMPISLGPIIGLRSGRTTMMFGYVVASPSGTKHYPAMITTHLGVMF